MSAQLVLRRTSQSTVRACHADRAHRRNSRALQHPTHYHWCAALRLWGRVRRKLCKSMLQCGSSGLASIERAANAAHAKPEPAQQTAQGPTELAICIVVSSCSQLRRARKSTAASQATTATSCCQARHTQPLKRARAHKKIAVLASQSWLARTQCFGQTPASRASGAASSAPCALQHARERSRAVPGMTVELFPSLYALLLVTAPLTVALHQPRSPSNASHVARSCRAT